MASECHYNDSTGKPQQEEEEEEGEFDRMVKQIGGRGNFYLVGDADGESNGNLFKEFILDMFRTSVEIMCSKPAAVANGDFKRGESNCPSPRLCPDSHAAHMKGDSANVEPQTATHTVTCARNCANGARKSRTIHCAVVIFIFRHAFIQNKANRVCMVEILRDIKSRAKKAHGVRQALIGLVHAEVESSETHESVTLLQETLRSVFKKRPHNSIWTSHYTPNTPECMENIRRNVCKVVQAAQSTDNLPNRKLRLFWPLHHWFNRGHEDQSDAATDSQTKRGHPEEGIPLQMRPVPQS